MERFAGNGVVFLSIRWWRGVGGGCVCHRVASRSVCPSPNRLLDRSSPVTAPPGSRHCVMYISHKTSYEKQLWWLRIKQNETQNSQVVPKIFCHLVLDRP